MTQLRSILIFEQAIKSDATKKAYKYQLNKFKKWAKIKSFDGLLQAPQKNIQILLEDYVMYLKKTISPNSIPIYFAPIELFYVMNDLNLNFKKIWKLFPEKVKKGNERGYTHEEVRIILNAAKTKRSKALVLLYASSGCRLGAIQDIKLKHLSKIEESYAVKIYEGDKEEDYVFTTPEATKVLDSYLNERKKDGEYMDGETPLFRTQYRLGIEKVKPCKNDNITHIMGRLVSVIERKKTTRSNRFDIPKNHGFRKFFATIIKDTVGITPTMTEKLINHIGIVQMDGAYFTPSIEKMFESYKKTIPELTIDQTEKQRAVIENKNKKISELEERQTKIDVLEKRLNEFVDSEKDTLQAFELIKKGYATLEKVKDGEIHLRFTDKSVVKKSKK